MVAVGALVEAAKIGLPDISPPEYVATIEDVEDRFASQFTLTDIGDPCATEYLALR